MQAKHAIAQALQRPILLSDTTCAWPAHAARMINLAEAKLWGFRITGEL